MSDVAVTEKNGIKIILPANYKRGDADCSVCGLALRDMQDVFEHRQHGCCTDCSLIFRQPNTKKWTDGWRPSRKQVLDAIFIDKQGDSDA
tara:strand:- start:2114 stop:2383 length:270 start_codon:yes stop_codon:yes gene_type:complete